MIVVDPSGLRSGGAHPYHEFAYPREMMQNIVKSLKPGGRVIQIE